MMRLQVALILFLIFVTGASVSAAEKVPIVEMGATTLRAQSGKRSVEASIITYKRPAALHHDEEDATAPVRNVVRAITITLDGQRVFVPRSVICGLVLPYRGELRVGPGLSALTIEGGDTSASYIVRIEFDSERVRRMTHASSLIPDKPLQITTFYKQTLEEPPLKRR